MSMEEKVTTSQKGEIAVIDESVSIGQMPATLKEAMQFSHIIAASSFIPDIYRGKPGDILCAMQMGAELGLKPLAALQNIAVINGRPSIWGDVMLGIVKAHQSFEYIDETMNEDKNIATCRVKRKGQPPVTRTFSIDDAKKAGLVGVDGKGRGKDDYAKSKSTWTCYPARMLQMRARGFALRDCYPDLLRGIIAREEAQDVPSDETWEKSLGVDVDIPKTATEKLKGKLKAQQSPETTKLEKLLTAIAVAVSMEQLRATGALGKGLSVEDKATAKAAYTARSAEISASMQPEQAELPHSETETLKEQLVEGIGIIGDQAWECIRAEENLPKSFDKMSEEQLKTAIKRIDQKASEK